MNVLVFALCGLAVSHPLEAKDWTYAPNSYSVNTSNCCGFASNGCAELCGPENWDVIYPGCAADFQSPINIAAVTPDPSLTAIEFDRNAACWSANLHNIQVAWDIELEGGCTEGFGVTFKGDRYTLLAIHFHSPSDNTISGSHFDLETHFVHASQVDGSYLVIGVMSSVSVSFASHGNDNEFLKIFWEQGFTEVSTPIDFEPLLESSLLASLTDVSDGFYLNPYDGLIPGDMSYYYTQYGSLTSPPCQPSHAANVQWITMASTAMTISSYQLASLRTSLNSNHTYSGDSNRPIQVRQGRDIGFYSSNSAGSQMQSILKDNDEEVDEARSTANAALVIASMSLSLIIIVLVMAFVWAMMKGIKRSPSDADDMEMMKAGH